MFFIRLFLANTRKKIGCHRACFLTNCRERWTQFSDRSQDREFARWRLGRDTKWRPSCSKSALDIKLVFGCFYVFDIANTEIHTWEDAKITKNEVSQDLMRFYSYEPLVETILQRWRFVNSSELRFDFVCFGAIKA